MSEDALDFINLTNYRRHPEREQFYVFFFGRENVADEFEILLQQKDLFYERNKEGQRILFGIKRRDLERVKELNYSVLGKNNPGLISDPIIKWGVLLIFVAALAVAVVGYYKTNFAP